MLDFARSRTEALPRIPVQFLVSAGTLTSFTWLLFTDSVHPFFVYLLQLYLTF